LQVLFVIRGLAFGLIIQPLNVSALSDIQPRKFAQASSLYTVLRFVSMSLGIAVLASLVQSEAKTHASQLAQQVTPGSALGQLAARLRASLILHGASPSAANAAVLQQITRQIQGQAYMFAIQDAFWRILCILIASIVAVCFVRMHKRPAAIPVPVEVAAADVS
jgi:DHA2 family multidrug resistance protein